MAFDKDAFLTALDSMSVMELNSWLRPSKKSLACPLLLWLLLLLGGAAGGGAAAAEEDRVQRRSDRRWR